MNLKKNKPSLFEFLSAQLVRSIIFDSTNLWAMKDPSFGQKRLCQNKTSCTLSWRFYIRILFKHFKIIIRDEFPFEIFTFKLCDGRGKTRSATSPFPLKRFPSNVPLSIVLLSKKNKFEKLESLHSV